MLSRPQTLTTDAIYLYQERTGIKYHQPPTVVKFLNYDPCPAIVIVHNLDGIKQRCLREELFRLGNIGH